MNALSKVHGYIRNLVAGSDSKASKESKGGQRIGHIEHPRADSGEAFLVGIMPDGSGSMELNGGKEQMEVGMQKFQSGFELLGSLAEQVELSLISFGRSENVQTMVPYTKLANCRFCELPAGTSTYIYEAYTRLIDETIEHIRNLRTRPVNQKDIGGAMLFFLSDFDALHDDTERFRQKALAAKERASEHNISLFMLMCGNKVDEEVAFELSQPDRRPVPIAIADIQNELATWLVRSVRASKASQGRRMLLGTFNGVELWIN